MENFVLEPTELANERPDLQFEDGTYTIPEILDSHLLPLVVQYDCGEHAIPFNKFHFDLTQPLLLYKKRNIQKVAASSLHIKDEKYKDLGESLLIPEDYKGWFAVLQRLTGSTKADDTVPHFSSVEELANSNTEKFLIGGTKKINGLQILDRSEGQIKHDQKYFFPGDTLTAEKVEYGEAKKRTRLFRKPKYIREKFLMCTDESDRDILLPFEQQGIFYQISHKSGKPTKNVMQMSDIVARKLTPRIIKLVFGRFPVTQCAFTGLMKAESSRIEQSVIASTIVNKQNILMEIPMNNELFFKIAVTNDALRKNACYQNAKHFCAERASTYMRNIKICYNFTMRGGKIKNTDIEQDRNSAAYVQLFRPRIDETNDENAEETDTPSIPSPNVRHSDISETSEISLRPSRCTSTSRMSLCFGNSYLTVPLFETCTEKRNSGNNNTTKEITYTTKRGSRISFNGKFMEMEGDIHLEDDKDAAQSTMVECPPPMACTNIGSYINTISPLRESEGSDFPNYIPISSSRRPSSHPPETAPPPIPLSSSTSGVSSGSLSSMSDGVNSKRASSDSCEYHVPKTDSCASSLSGSSRGTVTTGSTTASEAGASSRVRRPSTYTFAEGCKPMSQSFVGLKGDLVEELEESSVDIDSPIYENIQSLMEICKTLDIECGQIGTSGSVSEQSSPLTNDHHPDLNIRSSIETSYRGEPTELASISDLTFEYDKDLELSPTNVEDINENMYSETRKNDDEIQITDDSNNQYDGMFPGKLLNETLSTESNSNPLANENVSNETAESQFVQGQEGSALDELITDTTKNPEESEQATNENDMVGLECDFALNCIYSRDYGSMHCDTGDETQVIADADSECTSNNSQHKHPETRNGESDFDNDFDGIRNEFESHSGDSGCSDATIENDKTASFNSSPSGRRVGEVERIRTVSEGILCASSREQRDDWQCVVRKLRKTKSQRTDSGSCEVTRSSFPSDPQELCQLTTADVRRHFKTIGIREMTLSQMEDLDINGAVLSDILNGETTVRESMSGVNLIDQQKISMYIRGWRPEYE